MNDYEKECFKRIDPSIANRLPYEIASQLKGKGLLFEQAEAVLARAKDLLKKSEI
ncbi:hypothetical protein [Oscillibacter sp.]|uniref:hypothetical protein n=1 Tax=Oscillibacter sp. TaxID=1945593 RepID=UPI003398EADF